MTQNQLSMLRSQMSGQPMIIGQAPQTIFQTSNGQNIAIPLANLANYSFNNGNLPIIQQQVPQQQQQQVKEEQ